MATPLIKLSISFDSFRSLRDAFLNILPNSSEEPGANSSGSSTRSNQSGETLAKEPSLLSTSVQCDALPTKDIARRQASIAKAGSMPVPFSSAEIAVCQSWERGPIGSSIRPSMAVLKFAPRRFKHFVTKLSTFFGRKSGWKGTGVSPAIVILADFDKPWTTAAAANSMIGSATGVSELFGATVYHGLPIIILV